MRRFTVAFLLAATLAQAADADPAAECELLLGGQPPLTATMAEMLRAKSGGSIPVKGDVIWEPRPHIGALPVVFNGERQRWEIWLGDELKPGQPFTIQLYVPIINVDTAGLILPGAEVFAEALTGKRTEYTEGARANPPQYLLRVTHPGRFVSSSFTLGSDAPTDALSKDIDSRMDFVFKRYAEEKLLAPDQIEQAREMERRLTPSRKFHVVFSDPMTDETKMVMRLYDASPHDTNRTRFKSAVAASEYEKRLPIEIQYPALRLPERVAKGDQAHLYEIGRLAASKDVEKGIAPALDEMAWYIGNRYQFEFPEDGAIYVAAATKAARDVYAKRLHFTPVLGPENEPALRGDPSKNEPDEYVLRMSLKEFYERYGVSRRKRPSAPWTPKWRDEKRNVPLPRAPLPKVPQ